MARNTKIVTITADGRDRGKSFLITEMDAVRAEKWAIRTILACGRSGVDVPENIWSGGMANVAAMGLISMMRMHWEDAEPLLDEMFQCVRTIPDMQRPEVMRALVDSDIDEVVTRLQLRAETLSLHTGFSFAAVFSMLTAADTSPGTSPNTATSRTP